MLLRTIKGISQILLLLVILLPVTAYFMLKLPPIQTYIIQKITNEISQKTKTKVSIKSVNYKFFKSLILEDLYVEDAEGDTLASIAEVEANLANIWFAEKKINLSSVTLTNGQFNLITTNDTLNLNKLLERLSTNDTSVNVSESEGFSISTRQLKLNNFRFSLQNRDDTNETIPSQINFSNLQVDSIYLTANNIKAVADTIFFDIPELAFREKSGFHLVKISTGKKSYVCSHRAYLPGLSITDDYTYLKFDYFAMNFPNGSDDIDDYLNRVRMEANIADGYLAFKTIGFFAHDLASSDIVVFPHGKVNGTVADMHTYNFNISSSTCRTELTGDFSFKGLPDIDTTVFECKNLTVSTTINEINTIVEQVTHTGETVLGEEFEPFKSIDFSGKLSGFYNNFSIAGLFKTNLGTVQTDAKLDFAAFDRDFDITGSLELTDFYLGQFMGIENIKTVSLNMEMRAEQSVNEKFKLFARGEVSDLLFNGLNYKNINISGILSGNYFDGNVICDDENLKFNFLGRIDMNKTESVDYTFGFTADVAYADLYKLKVKTDDTVSVFSGKIAANLRGKGINFIGTAKLQNAKYKNSREIIDIETVQLKANQKGNSNSISLESSYFDVIYEGNTHFEDFMLNAQYIISKYIPNIHSDTSYNQNADYKLKIETKNTQNILRIINPELFIAENTVADLTVNCDEAKLNFKSDFIGIGKTMIKNIEISGSTDSDFKFNAKCDEMTAAGFNFTKPYIKGNISDNKISGEILYGNKNGNNGKINIQTQILKDSDENIYYGFKIDTSQMIINNTAWNFVLTDMKIKDDYFEVSKFEAVCGEQKVTVNGIYSTLPNTSMRLELKDFNMANFNPVFEAEGYKFEGNIFGNARIANIGGDLMFFSDIKTTDIYANDWLLGKISILSRWADTAKGIEFLSKIVKNSEEKLDMRGLYTPKKNYFDLSFDAKKFELKIIEPLIVGELNEIEGNLTGILNLKGAGGRLSLLGDAVLNDVGFTVDFLKTHYLFSAPISFGKNAIKIKENTTLYDSQNNTGRLNATVNHENLKDFVFDINLNADKLLGLNTVKNDSNEFYGNAYISGILRLRGKLDDLNFNINVRPEKSTKIVIPLNSATISEKTLLTFENTNAVIKSNYEEKYITQIKENKEAGAAKSRLNIALTVTMNNNAEVQIVLDENSGDAITVTGSGALQMTINPSEEKFAVYGNYIIENGNFKWTLPMLNLLSKEFAINRGSRINFNGDLNRTKIDITADYVRSLRLSLRNLLADTTISNAKYPVVCRVQLTDNISNFTIKPIIEIQNIDVDTKARAQSMLNTDEKLWKQFSFLLAFGNFIPEEQMGSIISNASITSNISEILSNQLSAWLASLKVPVDLGVDIRTGNASTETEFDAHASFKMFEDRVEVSGNIGSAPRTSTSDIAGNFDVDVKLNPSGSLKFKAFSHSTDEYTYDTETSRQGGRISYQGGFNTWKELWNSMFHPGRLRRRREQLRQRRTDMRDSINVVRQDTGRFEIRPDTARIIP
ncbi:MAG: translocation/assembly module TamB [Prevotellaceae bacterium]|jgi:hypothetical protein|nr:translocation/assembly module TamB [Prevotellaceae bacterium]